MKKLLQFGCSINGKSLCDIEKIYGSVDFNGYTYVLLDQATTLDDDEDTYECAAVRIGDEIDLETGHIPQYFVTWETTMKFRKERKKAIKYGYDFDEGAACDWDNPLDIRYDFYSVQVDGVRQKTKYELAWENYTGFKGDTTWNRIWDQVPEQLIDDLSGEQLALVCHAINDAYHKGRRAKDPDGDC